MTAIAMLGLASSTALAGEFIDTARVTGTRPIIERVNTPMRNCVTETRRVEGIRGEGLAGPIIGGIVGALAGSGVGGGSGKTTATAVGAIAGTIVGDRLQNDEDRDHETAEVPHETCRTAQRTRSRITGYEVTYEYRGRTFNTTLPGLPGDSIGVRVRVTAHQP